MHMPWRTPSMRRSENHCQTPLRKVDLLAFFACAAGVSCCASGSSPFCFFVGGCSLTGTISLDVRFVWIRFCPFCIMSYALVSPAAILSLELLNGSGG